MVGKRVEAIHGPLVGRLPASRPLLLAVISQCQRYRPRQRAEAHRQEPFHLADKTPWVGWLSFPYVCGCG